MNVGLLVLSVLLIGFALLALKRQEDPGPILKRFMEQFVKLVPRLLAALIAAGFVAQLIPQQAIAQFLGADAGLIALPIAALTGIIVPAGPVIAFAIAAVFARAGASTPALVTFITSWSVFASHRILIYELPLLGPSFLRLRVSSVAVLPFVAGIIAMLVGLVTTFGTPVTHH